MNQKGFSLLEALISLAILTIIIFILYELMIGSMKASIFSESHNDLEVFAQRTVNEIQSSVIQSKLIYEEDALGISYRDLLIASDLDFAILPNSRMPIIEDIQNTILDPDSGSETFVGNSLIIARALEPVPVPFDHDENGVTPNINFLVDRYRLEFYFLTRQTSRNFNGSGGYVDLIRARTEDFSDYFQLSSAFAGLKPA